MPVLGMLRPGVVSLFRSVNHGVFDLREGDMEARGWDWFSDRRY